MQDDDDSAQNQRFQSAVGRRNAPGKSTRLDAEESVEDSDAKSSSEEDETEYQVQDNVYFLLVVCVGQCMWSLSCLYTAVYIGLAWYRVALVHLQYTQYMPSAEFACRMMSYAALVAPRRTLISSCVVSFVLRCITCTA